MNVIGPIEFDTWRSLRDTRESIEWCKKQDNPVYKKEISQETELYGQLMNEALGRV